MSQLRQSAVDGRRRHYFTGAMVKTQHLKALTPQKDNTLHLRVFLWAPSGTLAFFKGSKLWPPLLKLL